MRIKTFQGLCPNPTVVEKIASPPYDVVSTEEARLLAQGNPLSMLNVVHPEIHFPDGTDLYSGPVYAKAVENFETLQHEGNLIREKKAALYLYRQQMGAHSQDGLVAVCNVEDYENNLIKKHEKTRKDKEDDRTRLTSDTSANAGPVFLTYRDNTKIDALLKPISQNKPLYDFTAEDGIKHTVWRITDSSDAIIEAFGAIPCSYIADGHHRSASAARVARERGKANPNHTGKEDYNWFLCVLFPASQLQILSYNRTVKDLNGHTPAQLLEALQSQGTVHKNVAPNPDRAGIVHFYLEKTWYALELPVPQNADPVARLDVSILQDNVLHPLLGIKDPRVDKRIHFIGGIRGASSLEKAVDSGEAAVSFSLYPVGIKQLIDIADAGQIMPPKSTWFEPKLRSGLFIHTF